MTTMFGVGQPVRRSEDRRFLTGRGRYADDINLPGQAYGFVVRSPHAQARIASLDLARRRRRPAWSRCLPARISRRTASVASRPPTCRVEFLDRAADAGRHPWLRIGHWHQSQTPPGVRVDL